MKGNLGRQLLFGTYTYLERLGWFLIQLLPKILRKVIYKIIFGSFGKNVSIDEHCYFRYPWKIFISDNVTINRGCEFYPSFAFSDSKITLRQGVTVGPRVIFFGAGHDPYNLGRPDISGNIDIEAGAYIGGNTTVCYGNTIGENSVIGAGSVVVSDVTPNTMFAGNPAVFKKSILS